MEPLPRRERRRRHGEAAADVFHGSGGPEDAWKAPERQFEYLEHTADVQLHSWGKTLEEALQQCLLAMTGYITDLGCVQPDPECEGELVVEAADLLGLVYRVLDEALFRFCGDGILTCDAKITSLVAPELPLTATVNAGDVLAPSSAGAARARCVVKGERFDSGKHPPGTEVKAITYSNMTIVPPMSGTSGGASSSSSGAVMDEEGRSYPVDAHADESCFHLFVIVDI
jgi:SHS2 domain-containing protein